MTTEDRLVFSPGVLGVDRHGSPDADRGKRVRLPGVQRLHQLLPGHTLLHLRPLRTLPSLLRGVRTSKYRMPSDATLSSRYQ